MSSGRIPSIEGGIQPTIFDAKADILTATAADTPARLAVGANDTVLTADSTTATGLKWAAAAGGAYTQLATGTLSGAALNLTSISGSYKDLKLVVRNIDFANNNDRLRIRLNNNSTSVYGRHIAAVQSNVTLDSSATYTEYNNSTVNGLFIFDLYDYANSTTMKYGIINQVYNNGTIDYTYSFNNFITSATVAITEINLLAFDASNVASTFAGGTYFLYGVK
jgi:hypothetical protein